MLTTTQVLRTQTLSGTLGFEVMLISLFGYESLVSLDTTLDNIERYDHCVVMTHSTQAGYKIRIILNDDTCCYTDVLPMLNCEDVFQIHGNLMQSEVANCYDLWVSYMALK